VGSDLHAFVENKMASAHVPGLGVGIVQAERIAFLHGYGSAHADTEEPISPNTAFMLASISKTVTAVAVMQLVELDLLDLDRDVNDYLSFPVANPAAPDDPISTRMLLAHVSSIEDNWSVLSDLYVEGDSPIPLGVFLEEYLVPGGAYYTDGSYHGAPPLTRTSYSNVAVSLAGYLVEAVTGVDFADYCAVHIFEALRIDPCDWHLAGLGGVPLASPHTFNRITRRYKAIAHYGYPDYPDGQLRTSARGLARFMAALLGDGSFAGARILDAATVAEMERVQYPALDSTQGLVLYHEDGRIGHNGGDTGVATLMFYDPQAGTGALVLGNGSASLPWEWGALEDVLDRLFEEADGL